MANMMLGELKAEVLSTVGGDYTANIVRYLNKGLLELSTDSQVLTRADVTIVSGSFSLPTDCLIPKEVYIEGRPLDRYVKSNIPASESGTPLYWLRNGSNIKVTPEPVGNAAAQIVYVKNEVKMEAEADTHTLDGADDFLIAFAKWKVLIDAKGVSDEALYWKNEAREEQEKWNKLNRAQHQRPRRVRVGRWS